MRCDACPQRTLAVPAEAANSRQGDLEGAVADRPESGDDILSLVAVHLPNESQREVELVVGLPARGLDPSHRAEQALADVTRRVDADEQAVHGL